ncbi:hypothetical protein [Sphingobium cloacae]|uniref:Uncharacterized protein n=1 Tax=Sphingobium cloacae TaxID=120107 RepID=A0A1E1F2N1_9SPHN|nr:hypothetical protein [Sphingobium cloacae]BAV64779.1 hypothetical protein SCLO_1017390 [Sphingobium cloacae]
MRWLFDAIAHVGIELAGLLGDGVRWLLARPWRLAMLILALLCLWLHGQARSARDLAEARRVQAAAWQGKFRDQKAEMQKFVGMVRDARAEAARKDRENAARVGREGAAILQEVKNDHQADLAAARADLADRLRDARTRSGAASAAGGGGAADLSGVPVLSSGPLRPGEAAIVDEADLAICTANTVTLEALNAAWDRIARIDINGLQ